MKPAIKIRSGTAGYSVTTRHKVGESATTGLRIVLGDHELIGGASASKVEGDTGTGLRVGNILGVVKSSNVSSEFVIK